jgi:hypothetical protein
MNQFEKPKKEKLDLNELGPEILVLKHELDVLTASLSEEEKKEAEIEPILEKCKAILVSGKSSEDAVRKVKDILEETVSGLKKKLTSHILSKLDKLIRSARSLPKTLEKEKKELLGGVKTRLEEGLSEQLTAVDLLGALELIMKYLEFLDDENEGGKTQ